MNRRHFLKPLVAGAAVGMLPIPVFSQTEAVPYAKELPQTPFDVPEGSWTLAVFPDSQTLTRIAPEVFVRQADWVAAHRQSHDIRFVIHLGDITDHNLPEQWQNAKKAMDVIKRAGVPYSMLPGNHDLGENGACLDRSTLLNDHFSPRDYENSDKVMYHEDGKLENTAHTIQTPNGDFLIVSLEFGPRNQVIEWADQLVGAHPTHHVIVATHAYMYSDDTRYDFAKYGERQVWNPNTYGVAKLEAVNDAEAMWQKLLSRHSNIRFMLSGHVLNDGAARLASAGMDGKIVHQILSNYQLGVKPDRPFHGGGYFRLMQFLPDRKTVRVKTYSPWLDHWMTDDQQQFEVEI